MACSLRWSPPCQHYSLAGQEHGRTIPLREKAENRSAITVAEMCDRYLEAARAGLVTTRFRRAKRPATIAIDEGRVSRHIKPLLGTLRARDVTRSDVQRMADSIAQGKT